MKILFVNSLYHPNRVGGAEKVVRILAEDLLRQGHETVVAATQEGSGDATYELDGVRVHAIGLKNIYWPWSHVKRPPAATAVWHGINRHNPWMARALGRIIDLEKPDLVNTHNLTGFSCTAWSAVKARSLPLVHTLHDYSLICPKATMFKADRNCAGQCTACSMFTSPGKRLSTIADHVVGVSRFTLERHLGAGYFRGVRDARVIHNGLPGAPRRAAPRDQGSRPLRLGYVGQLTPPKGVEQLVRQMGAWDASQCELLVAGKGSAEFEANLREHAPGNVRFLGFVDPDEVYRDIDALVVPSLWEDPLPTSVLEASMHGVPAIVTRRGGLPETVLAGRTGLVYEPSEPNGLRRAIEVLLSDRGFLDAMRSHVLERARHFQLDRMRSDYLAVMTQALAAHATGAPSRVAPL